MLRLSMIELTVSNWPRSCDWFEIFLLSRPALVDEENGFALFEIGEVKLSLKSGSPQSNSTRVVFETDSLEAEIQRLADGGIHPTDEIKDSPEGYRRAVFLDPDGHRLSIFEWVKPPS